MRVDGNALGLSPGRGASRVMYVSQVGVRVQNGNLQRQHQLVTALAERYPGRVDVLSLLSPAGEVRRWLEGIGVKAQVLEGAYASAARLNAMAWYAGNVIACNKLGIGSDFRFPVRTPLPSGVARRYSSIVSLHAWPVVLLGLERFGARVAVDLNDVMAERHRRIGTRRWISLSTRVERTIVTSSARCFAVSDDDVAEFQRLYGVTVPCLPHLPAEYRELVDLAKRPRPEGAVGYLGSRNFTNEAMLRDLMAPAFLERLEADGIRLILAGGVCECLNSDDRAVLKRHGGEVMGRIERLVDFYERVGTVLNPAGPSTGLKVKALEGLLAGRMLVTTTYGADRCLRDAFGSLIVQLEWPLTPESLGDATARAVLTARDEAGVSVADHERGVATYVGRAERGLDMLLGRVAQ